jgi:hypothetical protein
MELLWILVELFLEIVIELFGEVVVRAISAAFPSSRNYFEKLGEFVASLLMGTFIGVIAGIISVFVFPTIFIKSEAVQISNLIISPFLIGFAVMGLAQMRKRRGKAPLRVDTFWNGFFFALGMSLLRYFMCRR